MENSHFISSGFLSIKTKDGFHFSIPSKEVPEIRRELENRKKRLERQLATLDLYLEGKTISDPDALRI